LYDTTTLPIALDKLINNDEFLTKSLVIFDESFPTDFKYYSLFGPKTGRPTIA
jgi:hypothetical protein